MVVIAGFGNPLLDLTVTLHDDDLLSKYNIVANEQAEISSQEMVNLVGYIKDLNPVITPGGSTQNTLRLIQWLLEEPNSTVMYGAVGCDENANTLKMLVEKDDVQTRYIQNPDRPTGIAIALVNGDVRTLIAHIGAAQYIQHKDFDYDEILRNVSLVYMEGFFLTLRVPVAKRVLEICDRNLIPFAFNLSAIYMTRVHADDVLYFSERCSLLFGNYNEYNALIKSLNLKDDVQSFVINLCKAYDKRNNLKFGKICVVTNGSHEIICVHSGGVVEIENVIPVPTNKIVDTTGAGDAFAAGFLYAYIKERTLPNCLKSGCVVANEIIQQPGCTVPHTKPNFFNIPTEGKNGSNQHS